NPWPTACPFACEVLLALCPACPAPAAVCPVVGRGAPRSDLERPDSAWRTAAAAADPPAARFRPARRSPFRGRPGSLATGAGCAGGGGTRRCSGQAAGLHSAAGHDRRRPGDRISAGALL